MSIYHRYAQGSVEKNQEFQLNEDNIHDYMRMCEDLNNELSWVRSMISLQNRLDAPTADDELLYTPEFIEKRLASLKKKYDWDDTSREYLRIQEELDKVNREVSVVFPQVMNEATATAELNARMEELNDKRIELEDASVELYAKKYDQLKKNLPKIFFMIVEGIDFETVKMCFSKFKMVLSGRVSAQLATEQLMSSSISKYNLPSNIYDHLKKGGKRK